MRESFNQWIKTRQLRTLFVFIGVLVLILAAVIGLLAQGSSKKPQQKPVDLTGIIDESFTEANTESAMLSQQQELDVMKTKMEKLAQALEEMKKSNEKAAQAPSPSSAMPVMPMSAPVMAADNPPVVQNPELWHPASAPQNNTALPVTQASSFAKPHSVPRIHRVSFRKKTVHKKPKPQNWLNPKHYVPSNTSVQAIVLGGADADASVNGQTKNNGTMLFKFLENGTLPNGQRSRLSGCRVSANTYGDISSERAFATLYRLSCAHPGEPIIDKQVTGWVFFNGKAGIKGQPLMRDNKVMQWAGFSGALAGVAQAAQYAQTVQQFGAYGASSVVPSGSIAPYAAYGGASKAADTLSQYYVKRAEQYHPVIQVGAGNLVTIVFKDGFYLEPEEAMQAHAQQRQGLHRNPAYTNANIAALNAQDASNPEEINFNVPHEVLDNIDRSNAQSRMQGVQP